MKHIAIFASGNGSNAENIITFFQENPGLAEVSLVICNKPEAGVIARATRLGVPVKVLPAAEIRNPEIILPILEEHSIDMIVLAGFLLMIPSFITEKYEGHIVNIHPSLLPAYGGKGMYGRYVHEAVIAAGEKKTGITIHAVTEKYDEGAIIFQASIDVLPDDTPATLEARIHNLEREHFPRIIAGLINNTIKNFSHEK